MKLAKVNVVGADLCVISGYYLVEDERIYTSHGVALSVFSIVALGSAKAEPVAHPLYVGAICLFYLYPELVIWVSKNG